MKHILTMVTLTMLSSSSAFAFKPDAPELTAAQKQMYVAAIKRVFPSAENIDVNQDYVMSPAHLEVTAIFNIRADLTKPTIGMECHFAGSQLKDCTPLQP
jgi:hypothetical protein